MFWLNPACRKAFSDAAADSYGGVADLTPADHYVEKQGRSTGRYRIDGHSASISFYLKKYYRLSWWQRWFAPLSDYPGPRELANLERAAELGVPVPEPIAAGADRDHRCQSLLAVRELVGFTPLHQYIPARFNALADRPRLRRELIRAIATIAQRLHQARYYHCDLYLCHFFIRERTADQAAASEPVDVPMTDKNPAKPLSSLFDLVLIDFGRLKRSSNSRWRVKDLAQLLFSSDLPGITRTDRMRFFKSYLGRKRLDDADRRLLRRVAWKAAIYHRHNRILARRAAA